MSKPIAEIYVNPKSKTTEILNQFLAKYIDQINEHLFIKRISVTNENIALVKKKGIDHTPTLVYNRRKVVSLEKIVKILTPPSEHKDHYGYGNTSSNDLVTQFQSSILDTGDDDPEEDDMSPEARSNALRQKMTAFQKKRPEMDGVEKKNKIGGGRKVKSTQPAKSKFDNDEDFKRASGMDNIIQTPSKKYMDDEDGDMILEDYYLTEALNSGKKVSNKISRRR